MAERSRYITIRDARKEGFSPGGDIDDSRLLDLIEDACAIINQATNLRFQPVYKDLFMAGTGDAILHFPEMHKILVVDRLAIRHADSTESLLDSEDYTIHEQRRWVEARTLSFQEDVLGLPERNVPGFATSLELAVNSRSLTNAQFPEGPDRIHFTGVIGEVDLCKEINTTIVAPLAKGGQSVELADASELEPDDMVLIDNKFVVIVDDISSNTIHFNRCVGAAATDAPARSWGGIVSRQLKRAVLMLVRDILPPINSSEFEERAFRSRLIEERTDKYHYKLSSQRGFSAGLNSTGNLEVDKILQHFNADTPPFVGYV